MYPGIKCFNNLKKKNYFLKNFLYICEPPPLMMTYEESKSAWGKILVNLFTNSNPKLKHLSGS